MMIETGKKRRTLTANVQVLFKNKQVAKQGGNVVGVVREQAEKELGRSIVTPENFLPKLGEKGNDLQ